MSLDGTYTGLKASIADWLNRADATTIAAIPDFIVLAEAQMHRRLIGRQRQGMPIPRRLILRSDASFATNNEYTAVPTDIAGPINFQLTATVGGTILDLDYLEPVNLQAMKSAAYANGTPTSIPFPGWPVYYTVIGSELQIFPVADQAYTGELTYIKRLAAASTLTNFILTDYPDAYLYGALVQSAPYLKDDSRITVWGTLFTAALDDICNADPMPTDKSTLRTEIAVIQRYSRSGGYNINTDR